MLSASYRRIFLRIIRKEILLITHLNQILKFIQPEFVHVLIDGRIVKEGGPELVDEIETNGFDVYRSEV